jgi:hypothetical protein
VVQNKTPCRNLIDSTDAAFTPSNGLSVAVPTNENSGGRKQYIAIRDPKQAQQYCPSSLHSSKSGMGKLGPDAT